jgi:hypothetical protein
MEDKYNSNCDRCDESLERGYSTRGKMEDDQWIELETVCFTCDKAEKLEKYQENGRLRTSLIMDAVLANCGNRSDVRYADINAANDRLSDKIHEFEDKVWMNGMKKIVTDCRVHGMSSPVDAKLDGEDIKVLTYDMAGRCVVTLDSKMHSVTMIIASDAPESYKEYFPNQKNFMGMQGIDATEEAATNLLDAVIKEWNENRFQLVEDGEVSMI